MARFEIQGMDETIAEMKRMGETTGPTTDRMLLAGAEEMKTAWVNAINRYDHVDTGAMRRSVGYAKKPKEIFGGKALDVYPRGKDKQGTRNAEKAFVLHYGRKNMTASHFVDAAETEGEPRATAAMVRVWDEHMGRS